MAASASIAARRFERVIGALLAPGAAGAIGREIQRTIAALEARTSMLDVGCGVASPLCRAGWKPFGIDVRSGAAEAHRAGGAPAAVGTAIALPFSTGRFDLVWSFGLLHHLNDREARNAIGEMIRVTAPNGATVIFDGVLPKPAWRRPLAALIRRCDRGRWMRREDALREMLSPGDGWTHRRLGYAGTGLEGLWCVRRCSRGS